MNRLLLTALVLSPFIFNGCVTGPNAERKHPMNALNGANYETSETGAPAAASNIPILKKKERLTRVRGVVYGGEALSAVPLRQLALELHDTKNRTVAKTRTQLDGTFEFAGHIPNGTYALVTDSNRYRGLQTIEVTDYEIGGLIVYARPLARAD